MPSQAGHDDTTKFEYMKLQYILTLASIPLVLALIAYRLYTWNKYTKNRKFGGNKMKKFADKIEGNKNVE